MIMKAKTAAFGRQCAPQGECRAPASTPYRLGGEVELPILRPADERAPFVGGEDERRPARVLAVTHCYGVAQLGDLDALPVALAPCALAPNGARQVHVAPTSPSMPVPWRWPRSAGPTWSG